MKKIYILIIICILSSVFLLDIPKEKEEKKYIKVEEEITSDFSDVTYVIVPEFVPKLNGIIIKLDNKFQEIKDKKDNLSQELESIGQIKDKKTWFIEYKKLMEKYPELNKETLEETFTKKELDMLYRVVQAEVGDYDFISKANVASVILNRHLFWEKSLYEVITDKNQFSTVSSNRYKKVVVDEETILACEYAWIAGDTTNGCVAFRSSYIPKKWYTYKNNYWELQFIDEAGHGFYK